MPALTSIALGVAAASTVASGVADIVAAGEQEDAALGQQGLAQRVGKLSPTELKQLDNSFARQEATIKREEELISAVDPALMEAGKQAFNLLRGQEAEILGPLKRDRQRQRSELRETLRRQLGPGFETSSAGIEALSRFDTETSDVMTRTQTGTALQLLGASQQTRQLAQAGQAQAEQNAQQGLQIYGAGKQRELSGILGTSQGVTQTAGGAARGFGNMFGDIAGMGGSAFTGMGGFESLMGGRGGSPSPAGQSPGGLSFQSKNFGKFS